MSARLAIGWRVTARPVGLRRRPRRLMPNWKSSDSDAMATRRERRLQGGLHHYSPRLIRSACASAVGARH
jgi:hypothetical protein